MIIPVVVSVVSFVYLVENRAYATLNLQPSAVSFKEDPTVLSVDLIGCPRNKNPAKRPTIFGERPSEKPNNPPSQPKKLLILFCPTSPTPLEFPLPISSCA